MEKNKIESIKVRAIYDDNPDTSWLGEYTDKAEDWAVCRHCGQFVFGAEQGNRRAEEIDNLIYGLEMDYDSDENERGQVQIEQEIEELKAERDKLELHDCPKSTRKYNYFKPYAGGEEEGSKHYKEYGLQDFERMEGLTRGDWSFIGIQAEATVSYPVNAAGTDRRIEHLTSGGLWGIESDSGDYLNEVMRDELSDLRRHLEQFNVSLDNWDELTDGIELTWD